MIKQNVMQHCNNFLLLLQSFSSCAYTFSENPLVVVG
uniref:Lipoprotein n=1 Tax=Rhizophora mucronata TaxID=61149 RepID=A0A2P2NC03_RHIMU